MIGLGESALRFFFEVGGWVAGCSGFLWLFGALL